MSALLEFCDHQRNCKRCGYERPAVASAICKRGRELYMKAQAEQREFREDTALDQRRGRTMREIQSERKAINESRIEDVTVSPNAPIELLKLGAWLALCWVVDDDERPVRLCQRLKNAAEGHR
jgi:hypothetical protein